MPRERCTDLFRCLSCSHVDELDFACTQARQKHQTDAATRGAALRHGLLGKCREMLKVLDGTAPSWNAGIKIALSERGEDSAYCARTLPSALVSRVARSSSGPLAAAHPNGTHARRIHM